MKDLNTSQYRPEEGNHPLGGSVATKNKEGIEVGRGTKEPSLHGKHTLEDKRNFSKNEPNVVDIDEDMGLRVRKSVVLDYIQGGGDGNGAEIDARIDDFKAANPEWIDHAEVDELYPTSDLTKSEIDYHKGPKVETD